jgi:hypothetical protein
MDAKRNYMKKASEKPVWIGQVQEIQYVPLLSVNESSSNHSNMFPLGNPFNPAENPLYVDVSTVLVALIKVLFV